MERRNVLSGDFVQLHSDAKEETQRKMEFRPHAVAYLDILGFKEFVISAESSLERRTELEKLFLDVLPRQVSMENNEFFPSIGMQCLSVSDSIVISVPVDHEHRAIHPALIAISIKSIQIAHALLDMGLLVRGAISVGNVYCSKTNIVGTGYQKAVIGERDAIHPQIILTESAIENMESFTSKGIQKAAFFTINEIGQKIINSIYPFPAYWGETKSMDERYDVTERYRKYRGTIVRNLNHGNARVREKWMWISRLFDANVSFSSYISDKTIAIGQDRPRIVINYLNLQDQDPKWLDVFKAPGVIAKFRPPKSPEIT